MLTILQILISLAVIYLLFGLMVSYISEWISGMLQFRGKMLRHAVIYLLRDEELGKQIYNHPQVQGLRSKYWKLTAYIPSSSYSAALIQMIAKSKDPKTVYNDFLAEVEKLPEGHLKTLLTSLSQRTSNIKDLSQAIERWYDDCMDRVSGWYKGRMNIVLMVISLIVTIAFNVDTVNIIRATHADPALRQRLNDLGAQLIADSAINAQVNHIREDIDYYEDYVNDSSVTASDTVLAQTQD